MATAQKHTRTETRTVTEEVTTYTLELSASEKDTLARHLEGSMGALFSIRLALIDAPVVDPAPLAVGDRVRVTLGDADSPIRARQLHGVVGRLLEIDQGPDNENLPYLVQVGSGHTAWVHSVERTS